MSFFVVGLLLLGWWTVRTHRRRSALRSGGALNAATWRVARRRRFHLGPRRWRLDDGNVL